MHSFFITGTDTNIGKTAITCSLIAKCIEEGFRAGGMKPVAAGCHIENGYIISDDVKKIIEVSNVDLNIKEINPYSFEPPIAPHISFKSNEIDINLIKKYLRSFENKMDYLFIEGVGGYAVPLTETFTTADLVGNLDIPVILVVGMKLGCINHTISAQRSTRHCDCHSCHQGYTEHGSDPLFNSKCFFHIVSNHITLVLDILKNTYSLDPSNTLLNY